MTENQLLSSVASGIRQSRKHAGLTMYELAELAGIDSGFLAYIETAKRLPSLNTLVKISTALRVPISRLIGETPYPQRDSSYQVTMRLHSIVNARTPSQRDDLLAILRFLTPKRAHHFRHLFVVRQLSRR